MARRRKKDDHWIELVARLAGLLLLISLISPQVRHALGVIGFCFFGLALVGLISFALYRLAARSRRPAYTNTFILPSITYANEAPASIEVPSCAQTAAATSDAELLKQMRSIDWFQFEQLVALVYRKQCYAVSRRGGANPDGGIDMIIEKDGTRTAVQCKHWKTWNVGVKAVREFLGALTASGIQRGLFVTLSGYTGEAKQLADKHGITILNEADLAVMLEATHARFDPAVLEILNDSRKLCPKCERELVLRTAGKGLGAGKHFWGCSTYPRCRFTMPVSKGQHSKRSAFSRL